MRNNKGFTLIELLAVIVILAIIAVITVPQVAEMIDSSRKGAAEDAFYGAIKSAELGWAKELQKDSTIVGQTCTSNGTTFECDSTVAGAGEIKIDTSGSVPVSGKIDLDDKGSASVTAKNALQYNGYYCCGNSSDVVCTRGDKPTATTIEDPDKHSIAQAACKFE